MENKKVDLGWQDSGWFEQLPKRNMHLYSLLKRYSEKKITGSKIVEMDKSIFPKHKNEVGQILP